MREGWVDTSVHYFGTENNCFGFEESIYRGKIFSITPRPFTNVVLFTYVRFHTNWRYSWFN
jgi:hypothetical protein